MPDYKNMYRNLFKAVTESIEILKQAQMDAEEMYIASSDADEKRVVNFKVVDSKQSDDLV